VTRFLKLRVGICKTIPRPGHPEFRGSRPDTIPARICSQAWGSSRYRQLEVTARMRLKGEGRQLFFSYVHSRARGDLNDFSNYLGTFPIPIIRATSSATSRPICPIAFWRGA